MKKTHSCLAIALSLALSACGGDGATAPTDSDQDTRRIDQRANPPGAPTALVATAGNAGVSLAFAAPANDGGSPITGYVASCSAAGVTRTGSGVSSPVTVTGLSNGVAYSCSVAATNASGTGAASNAVSVTPRA